MLIRQLIAILCLFPLLAMAADPAVYSHPKKGAVKGADVVAYYSLEPGAKAVIGSDKFSHTWNGAEWKFANAENLEKFAADPEAYAPQYGGYCAFAVSHNFTKPVNPNKWKIVDGKLYLNLNGTAYRKWQADQDAAIKRGNSNWPTALKTCEKHDNCRS
jgi:YHS domain-containing protein